MPVGKRLAPMLSELVAVLRRHDELDIDDDTAALLSGMSAATIDRRLATERRKHQLKGRSRTKPGSLLKSQIRVRTWVDWDHAVPGFVEIDLVSHDGGNASGEHAWTLTVIDIATGWTETHSVRNKARKWVLAAHDDIASVMPFPILGVDNDNGAEFINATCSPGAPTGRSPSPGRGRATKTTAATWSRRTGRSCASWSATTATTHGGTVAVQQDLGSAVEADGLFLPTAETRLQGPRRREGVETNTTRRPPRTGAPNATRQSPPSRGRSSPTPTPPSTPPPSNARSRH
jgi:hypothetical protein